MRLADRRVQPRCRPGGEPAAREAAPPDRDADAGPTPTGDHHQYVVDALRIPVTTAEASELAMDIDGDGSPDNALGQVAATVYSYGAAEPIVNDFVADGLILHLIDLQSTSLVDAANVRFGLFIGEDGDVPPDPADNFSATRRSRSSRARPRTACSRVRSPRASCAGPGAAHVKIVLFPVLATVPRVVRRRPRRG